MGFCCCCCFKWFMFIYLWQLWIFIAAHRLSTVAASGGYSLVAVPGSRCSAFSCCRARAQGAQGPSAVAAHGLIVVVQRPQSTGSVNCGLGVPWCVRSSWTRTEPVSPELAGRLFAIKLPGKPLPDYIFTKITLLYQQLFVLRNRN